MEVYPMVDEVTVLRVPKRTEQQLVAEYGSSGRIALATGHEVSTVTDQELQDLEAIESYIGAFVPDTTPLADLDMDGVFRYYSIQRRIRPILDLRILTEPVTSPRSQHSLERFIRDVRDMHAALGLVPDLAGKGNLVLDRRGFVKLIDINNFRRVVPNDEFSATLPNDLEPYAIGQKSIYGVLPPGFVDDLGHPIADLTLATLQNLEVRGLGRDVDQLQQDPFYAPLTCDKRRIALALLREDTA